MTQETLCETAYRIYKYAISRRNKFITAAEVEHALNISNQNARKYLNVLRDGNLVEYTEGSGWRVTKIKKIGNLQRYFFIGNKAVPKMYVPLTLFVLPIMLYLFFPTNSPSVILPLALLGFMGITWIVYTSYIETQQDMTPT